MDVKRLAAPDARREAAADWLQRLDHPRVGEEEIQSWLEWFGASDENREAFEELQSLRRGFRELPAEFREELKHRAGIAASRGKRRVRISMAIAASVSLLALGFGGWWMVQTAIEEATYTAPADRHRTVALEDGSALVLGADSVVAVTYSRATRSLDVRRGEAYFEVHRDPKRPFIVRAAGIRVTALGTAFNVERTTNKVTVTVTDGRVVVNVPEKTPDSTAAVSALASNSAPASNKINRPTYLSVGQQVTLPLAEPAVPAAPQKASTTEWQNGRADFINVPLADVLPVINRYTSTRLVIDDPRVADLTYSGTVFRSHIDEWVASLPHVYSLRAVPLDNNTVTLVSGAASVKSTTAQ